MSLQHWGPELVIQGLLKDIQVFYLNYFPIAFIINQDKIFTWAKLFLHQIMRMNFNMSCGIVNVNHFPVKSFDLCIELG